MGVSGGGGGGGGKLGGGVRGRLVGKWWGGCAV